MGWKPKPRWHSARSRWYAAIGERDARGKAAEVYAPAAITRTDEAGAWQWLTERLKARELVPTPGGLSVAHLAELYLAACDARVGVDDLARKHAENKAHHLGWFVGDFGPRPARSLKPDEVEAWLAKGRAKWSGNYVASIGRTVSACFRWGVKSGRLESNPVDGFSVPTVPDPPERYASKSEAAVWLAWIQQDARRRVAAVRRESERPAARAAVRNWHLLQRCLIHTGARPGELACLRWDDLEWDARRAADGRPFAVAKIPPTRWKSGRKTGRWRVIYFSPELSNALKRRSTKPGRHPTHVFYCLGPGDRGDKRPWRSGSELTQPGRRARNRLVEFRAAAVARRDAGAELRPMERWALAVEVEADGPDRFVNYLWRHTAASTLLMMGVDPTSVAKLLGTSAEMVMKVYGHLIDGHLVAAAGKLARPRRGA